MSENEKSLLTLLNLSDSKLWAEAMLMFRGITQQLELKNGRRSLAWLKYIWDAVLPETFRVIWRNKQNLQNREAWRNLQIPHHHVETDVPNFPWCSEFVVLISLMIGFQNIWENAATKKRGKDKNKNIVWKVETTWQRSGYLWKRRCLQSRWLGY